MSWQPLLDGAEREHLVAIIREISDAIPTAATTAEDLLDQAILFAYLAADNTIPDPDDRSSEALGRAITLASARGRLPLFGGAAGLGWTVAHLVGEETEGICEAIDRTLEGVLAVDWEHTYDLIGGLVGFGVYALERGAAGRPLAARVVAQLERQSQPRGAGLAWHTPARGLPAWQRERSPDGHWNLGMAHGIAGVIAVLARMVTAWSDPRARALLEAAVAHVLALAPYSQHGTHPAWECNASTPEIGPDGAPIGRIAWCYGDLGMAMALFAAAGTLDDRACRDRALDLARACAARDREAAWIADGGICHGAAGSAHAFNRLYRATAEPVFAAAARRWVEALLELRSELPLAGFPQLVRSHDAPPVWQRDPSLLTGAAGVALVAHALVSSIEPTWDRLLMLDVR